MKVLLLSDKDIGRGGGSIAMYRLHLCLKRTGIDSKILCKYKRLESSESVAIPLSRLAGNLEYQLRRVTSRLGLNDIHCLSTFRIKGLDAYLDADILDFHCIHGGFFNYLAIPSLTASKPAVISLHDMWPFTGHCTYSYDCDRWKTGCGNCPYPDSYPPIHRDGTRLEWNLKNWAYSRSNLAIVAQSHWLTDYARQSMLNRFPIYYITNGIDTEVYQPRDREKSRSHLGIPIGKKVLMFAAASLKDPRKGGDLLMKALQRLPQSLKAETTLLTLGDKSEGFGETVGIQALNLGYVSNDHLKTIAYSAADLFLFPTRADNLSLALIESIACGTPVVSFRVGGVPDVVRPGITGYLAEPENAKDLCGGIVQLLKDEPIRNYMSQQCRAIATKEYPLELQVQRYIAMYRQLLENKIGT